MGQAVLRLAALLAGAGLVSGLFVTWARARPDGGVFLWTSVVGACVALALYGWHTRSGEARRLRWHETVGLAAAGAVVTHLVLEVGAGLGSLGGMVHAIRSSLTVGGGHGLLLGAGAALVVHGVRGPPERPSGSGREERTAPEGATEVPAPGEPAGEGSAASSSDRASRVWSAVAAGVVFLAAFVVPVVVASDPTAVVPALAVAVAVVPPVVWLRMSRRGRSAPVPVQALAVALLAPFWGLGLLFLMGSPVVVTVVGTAFAGATILAERAIVGAVERDDDVGDAPGGGAGHASGAGARNQAGPAVPEEDAGR